MSGIPRVYSRRVSTQGTLRVNLRKASEYYRRHWKNALAEIRHHVAVTQTPGLFKASQRFIDALIPHLNARSVSEPFRSLDDRLVDGCCWAALQVIQFEERSAIESQSPRTPSPYPTRYYQRKLWEAQRRLEVNPLPSGVVLLRAENRRDKKNPLTGSLDNPDARKIEAFLLPNQDQWGWPSIDISLKGELVSDLLDAMRAATRFPHDLDSENAAKAIWGALFSDLGCTAGILRDRPGRPKASDVSARAAFLRYHRGLSWPQIADQFCSKHHHRSPLEDHTKNDAGHRCVDQYRKIAEQYWRNPPIAPAIAR